MGRGVTGRAPELWGKYMDQDNSKATKSEVLKVIIEDGSLVAIVKRTEADGHVWNEKIPFQEFQSEVRGDE